MYEMKRVSAAALALCFATVVHPAEWKYSTKNDAFANKEERTAVLRGTGSGPLNNLIIYNDTKGTRFVMLGASDINCFPSCTVFVKFDDAEPEAFPASSNKIVADAVTIDNYQHFVERVKLATDVVFRVRFHGYGRDITFNIDKPFDEALWDAARSEALLKKQCVENAINESFSDCMKRLTTKQ